MAGRLDDALGFHEQALRLRAQRQQLLADMLQVVGRVLAIDQQPVETGAGTNFSAVGIGQTQP